ncbi:MAG: protein kinase [Chlamydiota bacterium]
MKEMYPEEIGRYKILQRIGKGGMGEVFLAYDPVSARNVALKCIRKELQEKSTIRSRFLREAKIASQLTHPSIIPIYNIHTEKSSLYYTMSYVEGQTLRQILRETKEQEKQGETAHPIGGSIPNLCQVFLRICEGVGYAHAKTILHRDLKPENIIIGKYGEVMILDWGIADYAKMQKKSTKTGKVAGTVAYMAPERALGEKATYQTDIYSLGVILYQILTLELPFQRGNLEAFRKYLKEEKYINPIELAPYREIPHEILDIVKKCLSFHPENRYASLEDLTQDVKSAIQGKTCWTFITNLHPQEKNDWEFQEHVMIAKHTAITRHTDIAQWATLMVSKHNFSGNIRMEIELELLENSSGLGILFGVPESPERANLREGYCLWIKRSAPKLQLFRANVLVVEVDTFPKDAQEIHHIIIEKAHEHIRCFCNSALVFTYTLSLPLSGAHVGLLHRDTHFEINMFSMYSGSQSLMVNCLAIPDAFFAYQDYDTALLEYRRIRRAFPGRAEGRDAAFRAGITRLEKAKLSKEHKEALYLDALEEFESLHGTPGAPLKYLGKALTYKELADYDEEAKCLEFALKKFAKHPLLPIVEEHIVYRMHESTAYSRKAAYKMILLVARYFPSMLQKKEAPLLINSLEKHWQKLFFLEKEVKKLPLLTIILSFWTDAKQALLEIIHSLAKQLPETAPLLENALFCLSELGYYNDVRNLLEDFRASSKEAPLEKGLSLIKCTILKDDLAIKTLFTSSPKKLGLQEIRVLVHIIKKLLLRKEYRKIQQIQQKLPEEIDPKLVVYLHAGFLWACLLENQMHHAKKLIHHYSPAELSNDLSPMFSPYGLFLLRAKGEKAMETHFSSSLERPFPPTTSLLSYFLEKKFHAYSDWMQNAFYWEKQEFFLEMTLFCRATNQPKEAKNYEKKLEGRYTRDYRKDLCT